jgi:hypothetical protein
MGDALIGLGVLLVIIGPLLNLPVIWALHRWLAGPLAQKFLGPRIGSTNARWIGLVGSVGVVVLVHAVAYLPGKLRFDPLCEAQSTPRILATVEVPGFYRTRLYAYEAQRFLKDGLFEYVEGPNMNRQGDYVRYRLGEDGEVVEEPLAEPASPYEVEDALTLDGGITISRKSIRERSSGREIGRAASLHYSGGPLSLLLGIGAMSSCPDIRTEQGSRDFRTYYEFEKVILHGGGGAETSALRPERSTALAVP